MSQKVKTNNIPACIEVELPNIEVAKGKNCDTCYSRFKCWTNRGMALRVEKFTLSNDGMSGDKVKFMAYLPKCFRCSNLVGTYALIHISIAEQEQHIKSLIMSHTIRAEGTNPMEIEVESITRFTI